MAKEIIPTESLVPRILVIRGCKVMLDRDLAELYGVETRVLNQAVRRHIERFPGDFMFRITGREAGFLRSQFVTLEKGRGRHSKYPVAVFTEQGVAMLSSVLNSPRAIQVNIGIMRAFARLREMALGYKDLKEKIEKMEAKYDGQFAVVFKTLKKMLEPPEAPRKKIGFIKSR